MKEKVCPNFWSVLFFFQKSALPIKFCVGWSDLVSPCAGVIRSLLPAPPAGAWTEGLPGLRKPRWKRSRKRADVQVKIRLVWKHVVSCRQHRAFLASCLLSTSSHPEVFQESLLGHAGFLRPVYLRIIYPSSSSA